MNLSAVLRVILDEYTLPLAGVHGVAHWARVLENGLKLAKETGANTVVVSLFAVLHDSRRENESTDPEHGPRAAEFARTLRGRAFELSDDEFSLLAAACRQHTHARTHADPTIATCFDADRLDLLRVGIMPHASRLCTDAGRRASTIEWANARAEIQTTPAFVSAEWGIRLHGE